MDDMNAKELFRKPVTEAGELPPEGPPPSRPPLKLTGRMRRVPYHAPGSEMGGEDMPPEDFPSGGGEDIARMTGRAPKSQFNPKELSQLKDVMILMLANMMGSDMDKQIGEALMNGQPLDPGLLQHILDEARQLQLPESHNALLQKIFSQLGQ